MSLAAPVDPGLAFVKENAIRQACTVVLPGFYQHPHPVVDILVHENTGCDSVVCHLAMLPRAPAADDIADTPKSNVSELYFFLDDAHSNCCDLPKCLNGV